MEQQQRDDCVVGELGDAERDQESARERQRGPAWVAGEKRKIGLSTRRSARPGLKLQGEGAGDGDGDGNGWRSDFQSPWTEQRASTEGIRPSTRS